MQIKQTITVFTLLLSVCLVALNTAEAQDSTPDEALNLAGIWYAPETPGDGFTLTQGSAGLLIYYFGYDGNGQRLWLASDVIATPIHAGESVSVAAFVGDGGFFDVPGSTVTPWGTLSITVESCEAVVFDLEGADGRKTIEGVRLADGGEPCPGSEVVTSEVPFQELYAQGVDRYLGTFTPGSSEVVAAGVVTYSFSEEGGPLCYTGGEYAMSTREGAGNNLLIFLQGGGACGPEVCDAVEDIWPVVNWGILDPIFPGNPAAEFDLGYLPYCDGTLFSGDRDVDSNGDGEDDRFFRGLKNLSASLDVIVSSYPEPARIVLAGNSAGGMGIHYALPLVRKLYPDVAIELVNDSGVGISSPGSQDQINEYWNAGAFFPASCDDCIGEDGHLTGYHKYQLAQDPNVRMGFISSKQDERIADESLMIGGPAFEAALIPAMVELQQAFPDRFASLIADGTEHTFILKQFDYPIAGTTVQQWVADMLSGNEAWTSLID